MTSNASSGPNAQQAAAGADSAGTEGPRIRGTGWSRNRARLPARREARRFASPTSRYASATKSAHEPESTTILASASVGRHRGQRYDARSSAQRRRRRSPRTRFELLPRRATLSPGLETGPRRGALATRSTRSGRARAHVRLRSPRAASATREGRPRWAWRCRIDAMSSPGCQRMRGVSRAHGSSAGRSSAEEEAHEKLGGLRGGLSGYKKFRRPAHLRGSGTTASRGFARAHPHRGRRLRRTRVCEGSPISVRIVANPCSEPLGDQRRAAGRLFDAQIDWDLHGQGWGATHAGRLARSSHGPTMGTASTRSDERG